MTSTTAGDEFSQESKLGQEIPRGRRRSIRKGRRWRLAAPATFALLLDALRHITCLCGGPAQIKFK